MKASSCFVVICGLLVSSDFAFGISFGIHKFVAIRKADAEAAPSEDAIIPVTDDLVKKAEERFVKIQQSLIRDINNQESEESLIQNLQNKTIKQMKIFGDKVVQTEEKVVSMGTKDNATIAIYKIINIRPLSSFGIKKESEKSDSVQTETADQPSEKSNKSSNESESEPKVDPAENTQSPAENEQSSPNDQPTQAPTDQPAENESVQNEQSTQAQPDQSAQNESAQNVRPVISILGPDGIPKPIHGIAIKISPKSDGTEGKDVAFQFFKK